MNYTTAIMLINQNIRAVMGTYERDEDQGGGRSAPRTMFKTFDKTIQVGDFVIVPTDTRHKMTVIKIVDVEPEVDFDSTTPVAWIIGKVNLADFAQITKMEDEAIQAIKSAEKLKKRNELRDALMADSAEKIKALPISNMTDALPPPSPDASAKDAPQASARDVG